MKRFLILFCLFFTSSVFAQQAEKVIIHQDARIEQYFQIQKNRYVIAQPQYIYRIQLISTYQRDAADRTRSKFRNLFPNESSFIQHDGVKFIVRAGNFASKAEAEIMLQEIRRNFPASFILPPELVETE